MHSTLEKMYNKFVATMQTVTISLAQFKKIRPFNVRSVKREGCLCKVCESYDNLMSGVEEAVEKLDEHFTAAEESFKVSYSEKGGSDDVDNETAGWRARTKFIFDLAASRKKADHMKAMLCEHGNPALAKDDCVNGVCKSDNCGFQRRWKKLRKLIVFNGTIQTYSVCKTPMKAIKSGVHLMPSAPAVFMSVVEFSAFESVPTEDDENGSSDATSNVDEDVDWGAAQKRNVRLVNVRKQASIIELLDMLDESFLGMCQHRRTVARCKDAARDLHEKATPGVMVVNEDWAEKFVISPARMLQSQYWAQISSSIFVSVLAWLDSARWHDRHVLAKGSWVTTVDGKALEVVEQSGEDVTVKSEPKPIKVKRCDLKSMLREGDEVTTTEGEYGRVSSQLGTRVKVIFENGVRECERSSLHHRFWVTKAFFGITNDRKQCVPER
jgi:hypothetical protein